MWLVIFEGPHFLFLPWASNRFGMTLIMKIWKAETMRVQGTKNSGDNLLLLRDWGTTKTHSALRNTWLRGGIWLKLKQGGSRKNQCDSLWTRSRSKKDKGTTRMSACCELKWGDALGCLSPTSRRIMNSQYYTNMTIEFLVFFMFYEVLMYKLSHPFICKSP